MNPYQAAPEAMKAMGAWANYAHRFADQRLRLLIHMHTREARAGGETEERLYLLDAWRESPLYSEREQAALAWTEALTLVSQTHVPDAVYDEVRRQFAYEEFVKLTPARRHDQPLQPDRHQLPLGAPGVLRWCCGVKPDRRPADDCLVHRYPADRSRCGVADADIVFFGPLSRAADADAGARR
jgi:hypothetical protein